MPGTKTNLIELMRELAFLLELRGENPFKCRAYENAARVLEGLQGEPAEWLKSGVLAETKGIGKGLTEKIEEWAATGRIEEFDEIKADFPAALLEMNGIPGLGAKKIKALWEQLGVDSVEKLEAACKSGAVAGLAGFGAKSAEKILAGIDQRRKFSGRHRADVARAAAESILAHLARVKSIRRIETAGSLRRGRETVKDLDFVVESDDAEAVMTAFVSAPGVARVVNHGPTKSSVLMESGVPADLRVVHKTEFAAALNYFTGSKEHNTRLRGRAKKMGMKLNEYGLFKEGSEKALPCATEAEIYKRLGLAYVEPELREDQGEIEAAESGVLPELIEMKDMRGLLHCHSTYSDGKSTLAEMAAAAKKAGYEYFGICDHSRSAGYAGGLKEEAVLRQHEEIEKLNAGFKGFRILKGIESDILAEGQLDYPDKFLERFDFIVASVHSRFSLGREEMTARVCRALEHPATCILGHPTGRLLLERDPFEIDLDRVFETAAKRKVALEINANPHRLDLDWTVLRRAKKAGCVFAIDPDAHHTSGIAHNAYGVTIARKGWLGPADVVNTKTLKQFEAWLAARRK